MRTVGKWFRKTQKWIGFEGLLLFVVLLVFRLNGVTIDEWIYGVALCVFCLLIMCGADLYQYVRKHRRLEKLQHMVLISLEQMPKPQDLLEEDYQQLVRLLHEDKQMNINELETKQRDLTEYYTMWMHQIKTPIAAIRLLSQTEELPQSKELEEEIFHIEQYVEMALQFLRVSSDTTDFLIASQSLDQIVREAVHKYARLFIRKKIHLQYEPLNVTVLSDEKWLTFVIEQILSNAIKYTPEGGTVSIYMDSESEKVLMIEDTGIGIRAEDLPRVCERGYTGYNGHNDKRSTGIGLYLCSRILKRLSHSIRIESTQGKGTKVLIDLAVEKRMFE